MKVTLVRPRGFCAGVVRAIDIVDIALKKFPHPIYVRKEIVHNRSVVESFKRQGVIFIDSIQEAPPGSLVIFSAHGVSPAVRQEALERVLALRRVGERGEVQGTAAADDIPLERGDRTAHRLDIRGGANSPVCTRPAGH